MIMVILYVLHYRTEIVRAALSRPLLSHPAAHEASSQTVAIYCDVVLLFMQLAYTTARLLTQFLCFSAAKLKKSN